MCLIRFSQNGEPRIGILRECNVIDLYKLNKALYPDKIIAQNMLSLIKEPSVLKKIEQWISKREIPEDFLITLNSIRMLAPIPNPSKIIGVSNNYYDYLSQMNKPIPSKPKLFSKLQNTIIGNNMTILLPSLSEQVGYEAELAVIIGKQGKNITIREAMSYIFGYTIINDVTASDIVRKDKAMYRGKNFDTFLPMGPYIVTKDRIPNPHSLDIKLKINGHIFQNSNTANMVFLIPELIRYISQDVTLEPGDIIMTGTPGGTSFTQKPFFFLKPGYQIEIFIEKIGYLCNNVKD